MWLRCWCPRCNNTLPIKLSVFSPLSPSSEPPQHITRPGSLTAAVVGDCETVALVTKLITSHSYLAAAYPQYKVYYSNNSCDGYYLSGIDNLRHRIRSGSLNWEPFSTAWSPVSDYATGPFPDKGSISIQCCSEEETLITGNDQELWKICSWKHCTQKNSDLFSFYFQI